MIEQIECDCGGTEFELYGDPKKGTLEGIVCNNCGVKGNTKPQPYKKPIQSQNDYDRAMKGIDL